MADVVFTVGSDIKAFTAGMNKLHAEVQNAAGRAESRFARMSQFLGSPKQLVGGLLGVSTVAGLAAKGFDLINTRAEEIDKQFGQHKQSVGALEAGYRFWLDNAAGGLLKIKEWAGDALSAVMEHIPATRGLADAYSALADNAAKLDAIEKARPARQQFEKIIADAQDRSMGDGLAGELARISRQGVNDTASIDATMAALRAANIPKELVDTLGGSQARSAVGGRVLDEALAAIEEAFAKDDDAAAKLYEQTQKTVEAEKERADAKARAAAATEEDIALSLKLSEAGRLRAVGLSAEARELEAQVRTQKQLADIARDGNLSAEARARLSGQVIRDAQLNAVADRLGGQGTVRDGGSFGRDVVGGLSASAGTLGVFSGGVVQPAQRAVQIGEAQLKAIEVMRDLVLRITNTGLKSVAVAG